MLALQRTWNALVLVAIITITVELVLDLGTNHRVGVIGLGLIAASSVVRQLVETWET